MNPIHRGALQGIGSLIGSARSFPQAFHRRFPLACALLGTLLAQLVGWPAHAGDTLPCSAEFAACALKLREAALASLEPRVIIPTNSHPFPIGGEFPWKRNIVTTVFWVGEPAGVNNPVDNRSSSWDLSWFRSFGGIDAPERAARRDFLPTAFVPRQNPFYCALPYNDIAQGATKPEAARVIPWFKKAFVRDGQSVCHNHWIEIRNGRSGRICYAQWSDCGPFVTNHWQYVFGDERPKPNLNHGAGLDVSPAVRDYLGLGGTSVTDWRFVDFPEVPNGPWAQYGDNNSFTQIRRQTTAWVASATAPVAMR